MSLDDDVPLILTLDEGGNAPPAPSNSLGQEELPSKSKMVDWAAGTEDMGLGLLGEAGALSPGPTFEPSDAIAPPSSGPGRGLCASGSPVGLSHPLPHT